MRTRLPYLLAAFLLVAGAADAKTLKLSVRPGKVKKGQETQQCWPAKFPLKEDAEVNRIQIFVKGGSHHVHLYRPYPGVTDYPPKNCPFAIDFSKWQLVAATQSPVLDWQLPPDVGINFKGRQPLLIQTHFVNTESLTVKGRPRAKMYLHTMPRGSAKAFGGALFGQDRTVEVPPGASTVYGRCAMTGTGPTARPMTIMALTGHYHFRGIKFELFRTLADGSMGERIYLSEGYADPIFQQYGSDAPLVLQAGEGLEWRCSYLNNTSETFKFGPNTAMDEHCNFFGFYYPTHEPQEAVDCIRMFGNPAARTDPIEIRCGADGVVCPPNPPPAPAPGN
jgi:hypothetical protein